MKKHYYHIHVCILKHMWHPWWTWKDSWKTSPFDGMDSCNEPSWPNIGCILQFFCIEKNSNCSYKNLDNENVYKIEFPFVHLAKLLGELVIACLNWQTTFPVTLRHNSITYRSVYDTEENLDATKFKFFFQATYL